MPVRLVAAFVAILLSLVFTVHADTPVAADEPQAVPADSQEAVAELDFFASGVVWLDDVCNAVKDCSDGTQVQCNGTVSCNVLSNGVSCDGVTTTCPSSYCEAHLDCQCSCDTVHISCSSNSGDCQENAASVVCDGIFTSCFKTCRQACPYQYP